MANRLYALSIALIFVLVSMSGCIFSDSSTVDEVSDEGEYTSIYDRHTLTWQDNHTVSYTHLTLPTKDSV